MLGESGLWASIIFITAWGGLPWMLMFSRLLLQLWRARLEEAPASIIHSIYSEGTERKALSSQKENRVSCLNNPLSAPQPQIM